jgi:hypothetical protein
MIGSLHNFTINDHAYRVNWAFTWDAPTNAIKIMFYEDHPTWASLKVEGNDIRRLLLQGKQVVLIENPGSEVRLPVDSYNYNRIIVGKTNRTPWFETRFLQPLSITAINTTVLRAGGPLTNLVTASLNGRSVRMDYQLLGSHGHSYQSTDSSHPPTFTVIHNGRTIASGNFEYG